MFVKRVRRSENSRFILTTRAHIFEEARRISDHVDDRRLQLSKYLLDVGVYTRKLRSHIFYNHLLVSGLSNQHFVSILEGDWLGKIVDHKTIILVLLLQFPVTLSIVLNLKTILDISILLYKTQTLFGANHLETLT